MAETNTTPYVCNKLGLTDSTIGAMLDEIRSTLDLSIERMLVEPG